MPESDLQLIHEAALKAGEIAMSFYGNQPKQWDKGDGQGPVCEADFIIDAMLLDRFSKARPDYAILSEEAEDDQTRCNADVVFIVDPIDGTRSFLNHHENFATSIAIARGGVVSEAVVHLPAKGLTCLVAQGRFDGMMTLRPTWEWDVAAGNLICTEAGASVRTQDGVAPTYNSQSGKMNGMVAGNGALLDAFFTYL